MLYQNWLDGLGLSSSAVRLRRSLASSLSNYIELYYGEDYPLFRNIFPKGVAHVPHSFKNEKVPFTVDEFNHLIKTLDEQEEYQMKLYALLAYYTGSRRSECIQVLKECAEHEKVKDKEFYATNLVRGKGAGKNGKPFKLYFNDTVMDAMKEWLEIRGMDDEPALFVRRFKDGRVEPLQRETFNEWTSGKFSEILAMRITPHMFRRSRATHMVVDEGLSIDKAKSLLNHESSETTSIYVIKDGGDDLDDIF
jgi:integrase